MSTPEEHPDSEGRAESPPDSPEMNSTDLYDVLDKEMKAAGKRTWLHRVYIIGSLDLKYEEPEDIQRRATRIKCELDVLPLSDPGYIQLDVFGAQCEQQIRQLHNSYREETASGLLLIYPRHMIHMLESSEDTIVAYLRELRKMTELQEPKVTDVKVLLFSHDIPSRMFEAWSFRSIVACATEQVDPDLSQRKAATGCLKQLLGLAEHLIKTPKANLRNALDMLTERVPELLPSEDLLTHLLQENDFLSVDAFLDLYYSELSFAKDSELVWPIPAHIFPYS